MPNDICTQQILPLVPTSAATNTVVQSGNWSNPSTWGSGSIPSTNANVYVPSGLTLTVDSVITTQLKTIRVDGTINFPGNIITSLTVDTFVVTDSGTLLMGNSTSPATATIIFPDGTINTTWDTYSISRGFLNMGTAAMYGKPLTPFVAVNSCNVGATTLSLATTPSNWNAGDQLLITGGDAFHAQDEVLTIQAISGTVVTLAAPLLFNHVAPDPALTHYVANLTRSIVFKSANPSGVRGHVHFCENTNIVNYVAFNDLGRTDKSIPISSTNLRGRYSCHFHLAGTDMSKPPATVTGCVVNGSPGWGYTNHSSYVNFNSCVGYNVFGATFVTEAGDETGSFIGNLACHSYGIQEDPSFRQATQDFAEVGVGFWMQGPAITVQNNVANDCRYGFDYYIQGLYVDSTTRVPVSSGGVQVQILSSNLPNPALAGGNPTIDPEAVAIFPCSGNTSFGGFAGVQVWRNLLATPPNHSIQQTSVMDSFTIWATYNEGFILQYASYVTIQNSWLLGGGGGSAISEAIESTTRNVINNNRIYGWGIGVDTDERGDLHTITGNYMNNVINVRVPMPVSTNARTVNIASNTFGTPSVSFLNGRTHYDVYMLDDVLHHTTVFGYADCFCPSQVSLDGAKVYSLAQAAEYIPFPIGTPNVPTNYQGLTNQQLMNSFGVAIGSEVAPNSAAIAYGLLAQVGTIASGPVIIDDGRSGYSDTGQSAGNWKSDSVLPHYGSGYRYTQSGTGTGKADWTTTVQPGNYKVYVTWPSAGNEFTAATYRVYDGTTLLGSLTANQTSSPNADQTAGGRPFQLVGTFAVQGVSLKVEITDSVGTGGGVFVTADAVMIVKA